MGEPMEPTTETPAPPPPTPALSVFFSQKALDASRTEILVLAAGVLFLASQVCLLVWLFSGRPRSAPAREEKRKVFIFLPDEEKHSSPAAVDIHDDSIRTGNENKQSSLSLRRRSSWGGRSAQPASDPWGRRKSAGSPRKLYDSDDDDGNEEDEGVRQGAQTSLSSPGPETEPEPEAGHVALAAIGDMSRMAAALATPATLPPRPAGHEAEGGGSGRGTEDTELSEFNPRRAWGEADPPASSIEEPRSPRVLAADQAAMMDALEDE